MNRRDFLSCWSLLLAMGATPLRAATAGTKPGKSVLIIGAGLAGLACGKALQQQGFQVQLIEGRNRSGGRIHTSRHWPDLPLDLGASWIHGVNGNPLTAVADQIKARRVLTSYQRVATYTTDGGLLTAAEQQRLEHISTQLQQALSYAQQQEADQSLDAAVAALRQQLSEQPQALAYLNFCLSGMIEQEYAGSSSELSAHWYDSALSFAGDDALFLDGYQVITDWLAQGLDIVLNQPADSIDWTQTKPVVRCGQQLFEADYLVVTLPLGVLQQLKVRFEPPLPEDKQQAIGQLGMGVLNKCYLRFEKAFWPADVDWLEYVAPHHGQWTEWLSLVRSTGQPVLLGFNAATQGRALEQLSDQQIVDSALQTLQQMFGNTVPTPVGHQISRWATDPFAGGAYSFTPVGATPELRDKLAAPLANRLFFAGEATSRHYYGTAHGAFLSGLRAAAEIAKQQP